ncbi:MAG TPA: DUF1553 domain-containing protein, partial [Planctomycetaceae bacterium]|nr:DUF1553 domain-containing protein [Planctomycetaceae bacterium]
PLKLTDASQSFASGGNTAAAAIDGDPQTGWSINGGQGRPHEAVFRLAEPAVGVSQLALQMIFERYYAAGLGRFRVSVTSAETPASARAIPSEIEKLLLLGENERTPAQREQLLRYYVSVAPELASERNEIENLRKQLPAQPTTLVFTERPAENPRSTFVHKRGEFLQPTERVEPDVLSALPAFPTNVPRNRLEFARWLVNRKNPLTARVTVNRAWAAIFGRGLVRTTEDFGFQGESPTHPELLDWLAVEFMNRGWSQKELHRMIVLSAAYQQSSRVTPELLEKDPLNRLLSRGARVRLDAELIRDAALRASGLMSEKIGGPSVFPPQPANVTSEGTYGALAWNVSTGDDRYRRGLYTFAKRTAPYAMFITFDAPSGEACVPRREASNTPLQALTLMNDTVFVEAAQALGKRATTMQGDDASKATHIFRSCLTRPPSPDELRDLVEFAKRQRERFAKKELDPAVTAGPGEGDPVERAVWTTLARVVLNLDEMVAKG